MSIESIYAEAEARARLEAEGQSFLVLTTDYEVARQVGPMMAADLDPTRRWGPVLHMEAVPVGVEARRLVHHAIEVVVQDLGPR